MPDQDCQFVDVFSTEEISRIEKEYDRLKDVCYLDHIGCAPYPSSLLQASFKDLASHIYSNPHSSSLTGRLSNDTIDQVRYKILEHFNTDTNEYTVIFTSGATAALRLVGESFRWSNNGSSNDQEWLPRDDAEAARSEEAEAGCLLYMEDNHTSVLGMREAARRRGAVVRCLSHEETLHRLEAAPEPPRTASEQAANSLFVYSAQCNFSGVKYPLAWVDKVHCGVLDSLSDKRSHWYCLLDAASFISTNRLDLSHVRPDFVTISFYKLFGYPTGLGALLVRNSSSHLLEKGYYGGGTVLIALSADNCYIPRPALHERFEDGTLNFLSIISLTHGFDAFRKMASFDKISQHCFTLARSLYHRLVRLHHSNGASAVLIYSDTVFDSHRTQGNIVNFNLKRSNGEFIGYAEVLHLADLHRIQLRTGCFCNPGACRRHLGLTLEDVKSHYQTGHVCGDSMDLVKGRPTGSVRVSLGHYNSKQDVDKLISFVEKCFIEKPVLRMLPHYWPSLAYRLKNKFHNAKKTSVIKQFDEKQLDDIGVKMKAINFVYFLYENIGELYNYEHKNVILKNKHMGSDLSLLEGSPSLRYDREWMITNSSGVALTQKTEPKMCLIRPILDFENNKLHLTFRGSPGISVQLEADKDTKEVPHPAEVVFCSSKVCGDRVSGVDCGEGASSWLSAVLARPGLRLIRMTARTHNNSGDKGKLSLSNQAQYLLINSASVDWLAEKLEQNIDCKKESMLDRFRSNFVLSGGVVKAFEEQNWTQVKIGSQVFNVEGGCGRCQMICIDQDTGERSKDPLTVLSGVMKGRLQFGIYLRRREAAEATICVGARVDVKGLPPPETSPPTLVRVEHS